MPFQRKLLVADFETTRVQENHDRDEHNWIQPEVHTWTLGSDQSDQIFHPQGKDVETLTDHEVDVSYGISLNSFIKFLMNLPHKDYRILFHNGSNFDYGYLIPGFIKYGLTYIPSYNIFKVVRSKFPHLETRYQKILTAVQKAHPNLVRLSQINNAIAYLWNNIQVGEFSAITTEKEAHFQILLPLARKEKPGRFYNITLWCSYQMFGGTIGEFGDIVGLPKGKSDYNRSKLYKDLQALKNDGNELAYAVRDVVILMKMVKKFEKILPMKEWKLTSSAMAYQKWQNFMGLPILKKYVKKKILLLKNSNEGEVKQGDGTAKSPFNLYKYPEDKYWVKSGKMIKQIFKRILPTAWLKDKPVVGGSTFYNELHQWFSGGLTHVNETYRGKIIKHVTSVDVNSSYSSVMASKVMVPVGKAQVGDSKLHPFKFYRLEVLRPNVKITNKKGLPFLVAKRAIATTRREYLKTLVYDDRNPWIYHFTSVSRKNVEKYYNLQEYVEGVDYKLTIEFSFKQIAIGTLFKEFVDHFYKLKNLATLEKNQVAKLFFKIMLNGVYGKFATKRDLESRYLDQENNWSKFVEEVNPKYYLPIGLVITELARMKLVDGVGEKYDHLIYTDTDSLHISEYLTNEWPHLEIDQEKLGAWKIELEGKIGFYRRAKQYTFYDPLTLKLIKPTFAGINFSRGDEPTLKDFVFGNLFLKQLRGRKTQNGKWLDDEQAMELKAVWDPEYPRLREQTRYKKEHFQAAIDFVLQLESNDIQMLEKETHHVWKRN